MRSARHSCVLTAALLVVILLHGQVSDILGQTAEGESSVRPDKQVDVANPEDAIESLRARLGTGTRHDGFGVSVESGLRKIFREPDQFAGSLKTAAAVSLAGHEHEGFQVVILPLWQDVLGVRLDFEDLTCEATSSVLSGENLSFYKVDYVQTRPPPLANTTYQSGSFPVGQWPDPLVPAQSVDVLQRDGIQPLWVDVYAPAGTKAGVYTGHLAVATSNLGTVAIPISIEVWDFSLPLEHHLKTAFSFSLSALHQFYMGKGSFEEDTQIPPAALRKVYDFLLDHRVSPTNIYNPHHRQQLPPREDLVYCVERGLDSFNIGRLVPGTWDSDEGRSYAAYLREYSAFLKDKGWSHLPYIYGPDEIQYRSNYEELKDRHREAVREARAIDPDLPIMATTDIDPDLHGWVDLWCPLPERWDPELGRSYAAEGERSWFYWCIGGSRPALLIDFPAIDPRLLPWVCWKYGAEGFLYYWINMWQGKEVGDSGPRYPDAPWEFVTPLKSGNGSGLLVYPGRSMGELISSIRFENIRDGLEDYEYLFRLKQLADEVEAAGGDASLISEARELLTVGAVVQGPTEFEEDTQVLQDQRSRIARQIVRLQNAL